MKRTRKSKSLNRKKSENASILNKSSKSRFISKRKRRRVHKSKLKSWTRAARTTTTAAASKQNADYGINIYEAKN
jgi:hypothetical protein